MNQHEVVLTLLANGWSDEGDDRLIGHRGQSCNDRMLGPVLEAIGPGDLALRLDSAQHGYAIARATGVDHASAGGDGTGSYFMVDDFPSCGSIDRLTPEQRGETLSIPASDGGGDQFVAERCCRKNGCRLGVGGGKERLEVTDACIGLVEPHR